MIDIIDSVGSEYLNTILIHLILTLQLLIVTNAKTKIKKQKQTQIVIRCNDSIGVWWVL